MNILLDTQCFLWMQAAPERFSQAVRACIQHPDTRLWLSAVSGWEIAIKYALGKLSLPAEPSEYVSSRMVRTNVQALAVAMNHGLAVAQLPMHHRDPFDRLLVVQSQLEALRLLTADRALAAYDVDILWASASETS